VVLGLGQSGDGDAAHDADRADADREGAPVRREQPRLDAQRLVKRGAGRRQPPPDEV
jgi:hypothetical protein